MKLVIFDIDTLRADHLGCYGYSRKTNSGEGISPNIDAIASQAVRFDNYYCPNAPCLPSRASLVTGQFGIHTGIVGHGGTAADLRPWGEDRHFTDTYSNNNLFMNFKRAGMYTASISTFAERHSSWWFNTGFNEIHNVGMGGCEIANQVTPIALDWLEKNREREDWVLHVHYWDPHTPYRTPAEYGNPFEGVPLCDDWITQEIFDEHLLHIGPHGANEVSMWNDSTSAEFPRQPGKIQNLAEMKDLVDNYDCGIKYTDDNIGLVLAKLKELGMYDDISFIVTSDHGENIGELGIYSEHGTADESTCRIPMIVKWQGGIGPHVDSGFHTNVDLCPTVQELLGNEMLDDGYEYDGMSFAQTLMDGSDCSQDSAVLTQCAHVCQRSARFGDYLYVRTLHGGYHLFPDEMLFNIKEDPHETKNIAAEHPELCAVGAKHILDWGDNMMKKSHYDVDPLWTVVQEGGPEHARGALPGFMKRLEGTDREFGVQLLKDKYGRDLNSKL